tara:strand:- start:905 stop:1603 length:699 start_codon:yes stop_codon:yes gene_type:complete
MICIAIPSRGRPQFLNQLVNTALSTATDPKNIVISYYLNDDDPQLQTYVDTLKKLTQEHNDSVQWKVGPDQNTVLSWEQICESIDADYYMLAGDEVTFETQGWDKKFEQTKQKYPDGIFCMSMYCGRGESRLNENVTPVVTKQWRQALGYFWGPMFWHWNVDQWTGDLAKAVDRFDYRSDITVRIKKIKKDPTGQRNRSAGIFNRDTWTYSKCKEIYFPGDVEKLKLAIKQS